jgi:hypothetical protein
MRTQIVYEDGILFYVLLPFSPFLEPLLGLRNECEGERILRDCMSGKRFLFFSTIALMMKRGRLIKIPTKALRVIPLGYVIC